MVKDGEHCALACLGMSLDLNLSALEVDQCHSSQLVPCILIRTVYTRLEYKIQIRQSVQKDILQANLYLKRHENNLAEIHLGAFGLVNVKKSIMTFPSLISEHLSCLPGKVNIRGILMLVTGDHPAQCKIAKLKQSGRSAGRQCKMHAALSNARAPSYVCGKNHEQFHIMPQKQTSKEFFASVCNLNRIPHSSRGACKRFSQATGIIGESPLWKFYHMYGFDMSQDIVSYAMHVAGLNLFKTYIAKLFEWISNDIFKLNKMNGICLTIKAS